MLRMEPADPANATTKARQFWIRAPGRGEIVATELAPRQAGEVLVRTLHTGISRGTEALVFRGEVPVSQHRTMRAPFQEGEFPGPVKYGYSSVGEVVEGPPELRGRTVFCLFPHQDVYCVPAAAVTPLPEGLPPGRAVLAANMETALNAVWDARPGPGDRVVVVGAGVVGLLTAWLCGRLPGAEVVVHDVDPGREDVAGALGLAFTSHAPEGADADLVVHASGQEDGLRTALAAAGLEATVLELSWYGSRSVTLPLGEAFHSRRLTLKSSQVGRIPAGRAARWDHARRMSTALRLLGDARLDALVSGESDFEDLPDIMAKLSRDPAGALCHRIRYRADSNAKRA
jgi:threonine dehydrogenase-like Zn-dependent dehydrogenase